MVSILIAARNEENNILNCLQAIDNLSYPASDLEILIGNDASEDQTELRTKQYIQDKPHFRLLPITYTVGKAKGKANVLAQLAAQAEGDFLFITDADVEVPPHWIETMLQACQPNTGLVTGCTLVKGVRFFDALQSLDWLFAQGMIHLATSFHIPVTALGNNMLVTRKAYMATGGYASLPFSVTEDFALFRAVIIHKFNFAQVVQKGALAYTEPARNVEELLRQRKRWMKGAFQLPVYLILPLLLQALFLPLLIALFFYIPWLAANLFLLKILFESAILLWMMSKLKHWKLIFYVILFEPYFSIISSISLVHYFQPGKIVWKGRKY